MPRAKGKCIMDKADQIADRDSKLECKASKKSCSKEKAQ